MKTILGVDDFKNLEDVRKAEQDKIKDCFIQKAEKEVEEKNDDFKHHKLMAGYHSVKANELNDEALKLSSSSNTELHVIAKEKKGEATRHQKSTEEHREKAKSFYDKEKHGDWNKTIPTKADALQYGSKQSKEADKEAERIQKEEDYEGQPKEVEKSEELIALGNFSPFKECIDSLKEIFKNVKKRGDVEKSEASGLDKSHASKYIRKQDGHYFYASESGKNYNIQQQLPDSAKHDLTKQDHKHLTEAHRYIKEEIGKDNPLYTHHLVGGMVHDTMGKDKDLNNEIVGRLNNGKIIRQNPQHPDHSDFTSTEHIEAADVPGLSKEAKHFHKYVAGIKDKNLKKSQAFDILGIK